MKLMLKDYSLCRIKCSGYSISRGSRILEKTPWEEFSPNYKGEFHIFHPILKGSLGISLTDKICGGGVQKNGETIF